MKRLIVTALVLAGSWMVGPEGKAHPPGVHPGIIFVANGSGDSTVVTENLCEVLSITKWPMKVDTIRWTSFGGPRRDHNDVARHRAFGRRLACRIQAAQQAFPGVKIYLMGHSSGTHVILAAAECLPPGSIDRIVLLAPSVSCSYDLRGALRATREGIDSYYSLQDPILDRVADTMGTADGVRDTPAAGQVGFRCPPPFVPDSQLYCLLRQYPWRPGTYDGTHNQGYHYGPTHYNFLRLVVLPNMVAFHQ
jgi:alpha/beta hydrolase family protein